MTETTAVTDGPPRSEVARRNVRAELARAGITHRDAAARVGLSYPAFRRRLDDPVPEREPVDFRIGELEALARLLRVPLARLTEEPRP